MSYNVMNTIYICIYSYILISIYLYIYMYVYVYVYIYACIYRPIGDSNAHLAWSALRVHSRTESSHKCVPTTA